jgi:hypothetical protein
VIVDWADEFDRWLSNAEEQGGRLLAIAVALLQPCPMPTHRTQSPQGRPRGNLVTLAR